MPASDIQILEHAQYVLAGMVLLLNIEIMFRHFDEHFLNNAAVHYELIEFLILHCSVITEGRHMRNIVFEHSTRIHESCRSLQIDPIVVDWIEDIPLLI